MYKINIARENPINKRPEHYFRVEVESYTRALEVYAELYEIYLPGKYIITITEWNNVGRDVTQNFQLNS